MTDAIPPTMDRSWVDVDLAVADAASILKLSTTGPDAPALQRCAEAAGELICIDLDRVTPIPGITPGVPPPPLRNAHAYVTIELWRRKDAPFGVLNAWSPDDVAIRIGADPLHGVRQMITPYKEQWGLG